MDRLATREMLDFQAFLDTSSGFKIADHKAQKEKLLPGGSEMHAPGSIVLLLPEIPCATYQSHVDQQHTRTTFRCSSSAYDCPGALRKDPTLPRSGQPTARGYLWV